MREIALKEQGAHEILCWDQGVHEVSFGDQRVCEYLLLRQWWYEKFHTETIGKFEVHAYSNFVAIFQTV
jgi:hypothetical protein